MGSRGSSVASSRVRGQSAVSGGGVGCWGRESVSVAGVGRVAAKRLPGVIIRGNAWEQIST